MKYIFFIYKCQILTKLQWQWRKSDIYSDMNKNTKIRNTCEITMPGWKKTWKMDEVFDFSVDFAWWGLKCVNNKPAGICDGSVTF